MTLHPTSRVKVLPHTDKNKDGTPRYDYATVLNPSVPADITLVDGRHIDHYIQIKRDAGGVIGNYHETSLEKIQ